MRTLKLGHIFTLTACIAAFAPLPASAQQPSTNAPPPPQLEPLQEGESPAITIRKPEERATIEEKRAPGGKVTETKVTTGGSTYYVKPNEPAGSALPGDTQSNTVRAAQWEVLQFDLGPTKEAVQDAAAQATEGTPPPPKAPARK